MAKNKQTTANLDVQRHILYQDVCSKIQELVKSKRLWGKHLAAERDLAEMFGVSRVTIRKSLDLLGKQGVVTRRHGRSTLVLPHKNGKAKSGQKRVLLASSEMPSTGLYLSGTLAALNEGAALNRWALSLSSLQTPAGRQQIFAALSGREYDGVILVSITDHVLMDEILRAWSGPAVLVDHHFPDMPLTSVIDDSQDGARQAVEHLLSLGHRRIGYVEISLRQNNPWRYQGYADALRSAGLEPDENLAVSSFSSFEAGRLAGEKLLELPDPPTAILAFDDQRAWGVWRAAETRGLEVGRNFALVGYGDTTAQAGFPEELSSVRIDPEEMGRQAVAKLSALMDGGAQPGELVKVPAKLVVRKSSRDARAAAASESRSN